MKKHYCQFHLTIPLNYEIICKRVYRQILSIEVQRVSKNIKIVFKICVLQHKEVVDEVFCVFTIPMFILFIRGFMMTIRKFSIFMITFAFIALVVGLTGCEKAMEMMPDGEMPDGEMPDGEMPDGEMPGITIGVAVAETGENAAPYGIPMKRGIELAQDQLNALGANIELVSVDNLSTVEGAKAAVQSLVDQGVPAIIGVGISTHLKEAFPIAQEAGVVAFSPISSAAGLSGEIGDYVFRAGLATNILIPRGVMQTHAAASYATAAIIYDDADAYSTSLKDELTKALETAGVTLTSTQKFVTTDTDFTTQLETIKGEAPNVVFVAALSTQMVQIIKKASELEIPSETTRLIVPDLTATEVAAADGAAEGAFAFAGWSELDDSPKNQAFVQSYMAKHDGETPSPWAAQAYATMNILANAINTAGSADSAAIRDALAQTMEFDTVLGPFSFDPNGEAIYEQIVILEVKDGVLQVPSSP